MRRTGIDARALSLAGLLLACGVVVFPQRARAQETEDPAIAGMSRMLRMGIRHYERGEDIQAMDRFMDVLTKGDPSERAMANDYINLITHRMNTGERDPSAPKRPGEVKTAEKPKEVPIEAPKQKGPAVVAEPDGLEEPELDAGAPRVGAKTAANAATAAAGAAGRGGVPTAPRAPEIVAEPDDVVAVSRQVRRPQAMQEAAGAAAARAPRAAAESAMPPVNKTLMKKEIKAKLHAALDIGLNQLREVEGVRVLMLSNGDPQAIAIPASLMFQTGIAFQKDAVVLLDALTKVVFSLGGAQVIILPEGTTIGDAKVLDMRRTMGISAHLFSAGVAPPRVRVNLLNTQVDIPKPLLDFKGIIVLFLYNQPLQLTVESALGEEAGPPVSLGIYPPTIRPDRGEGSVIEFSVQDPPAGLVSWKFQLLEPSEGGPTDLLPLQEVVGGSPVFHQIFWNGRRNYFGSPLPAGRYEVVLTATDSKNRQRALHRWIQVVDAAGNIGAVAPKPAAAPAPTAAAPVTPAAAAKSAAPVVAEKIPAGAPSAELGADDIGEALIKDKPKAAAKPGKRAKTAARAPGKKKGAAKPKAEDAEAAPEGEAPAEEPAAEPAVETKKPSAAAAAKGGGANKPSKPTSGSYELAFNRNSHQLTPEAEKRLAQIADTVAYYPLEGLRIHGSALSAESGSAVLAERRAKMVAGLLINKYQIDPKKIQVASSVAQGDSFGVKVTFVKDQ